VTFLTAPTVVVLIDNHTDISFVFSNTEEEQTKTNLSSEFVFSQSNSNQHSIELLSNKSLIKSKMMHHVQSLYPEVISPPPDLG